MVGFDVTCDGAPGPALLATTIAGNQLLSMGPKADAKGGPGRSLTIPGGLEDGEDYPCRRRQRYAALLGEGAAECRLRRDLLRQRALGLSTAAGRAVRASAHRHRHAGDGWDRIGAP